MTARETVAAAAAAAAATGSKPAAEGARGIARTVAAVEESAAMIRVYVMLSNSRGRMRATMMEGVSDGSHRSEGEAAEAEVADLLPAPTPAATPIGAAEGEGGEMRP